MRITRRWPIQLQLINRGYVEVGRRVTAPADDSLHLRFGSVFHEDTVKQTGMRGTGGQGASSC
jgi:hypothetical protein